MSKFLRASVVSESKEGFATTTTYYNIQVSDSRSGKTWELRHKFKHFNSLHTALKTAHPHLKVHDFGQSWAYIDLPGGSDDKLRSDLVKTLLADVMQLDPLPREVYTFLEAPLPVQETIAPPSGDNRSAPMNPPTKSPSTSKPAQPTNTSSTTTTSTGKATSEEYSSKQLSARVVSQYTEGFATTITFYVVQVNNPSSSPSSWEVNHRFKHFHSLHSALKTAHPQLKTHDFSQSWAYIDLPGGADDKKRYDLVSAFLLDVMKISPVPREVHNFLGTPESKKGAGSAAGGGGEVDMSKLDPTMVELVESENALMIESEQRRAEIVSGIIITT